MSERKHLKSWAISDVVLYKIKYWGQKNLMLRSNNLWTDNILKQEMPHCVTPHWLTDCTSSRLHLALAVLEWRSFVYSMLLVSQPPMYFLDFPALLQQETCLMGASERNSWKLNATCPHEFLRGLPSYCATNVCDRNINRSADVLSWVLKLPARQSVITCHVLGGTTHSDTWALANIQL